MKEDELARRLTTREAELVAAQSRIDALVAKNKALEASKTKLRRAKQQLTAERERLRCSPEYRLGKRLWRLFAWMFPSRKTATPPLGDAALDPLRDYAAWRLTQLRSPAELTAQRVEAEAWTPAPLISILLPTYNTPVEFLDAALESVIGQTNPHWELVIADDASPDPNLAPRLREWAARDARIRVSFLATNQGIAFATNAALAEARGEFVALLDHDDWLEPDALFEVAQALRANAEADFIYTDEDKFEEGSGYRKPFFKPDWSPNALLSCNYLCHFSVIRCAVLERLGGFRAGFDGAQDYDLFLRATELARVILHVPRVLYHWRMSASSTAGDSTQKPAAIENGRRAVAAAVARRGLDARVEATQGARYRVRYTVADARKITILIPTRDRLDLLARCIESVERLTDYPNFEIVLIDNGSEEAATGAYFARTAHRVLSYSGPFNFAALCNYGVRETAGDWLLFLNNDIEVVDPGWLSAMAEHIQRPEVGAVGARLLFPDDTVQHAGVVFAEAKVASHVFLGAKRNSFENGGLLQIVRDVSAVTAACLLTRREVFVAAGGFDEQRFAVSYNDADYCLRLRERGLQVVYTPFATLYHHESQSRGRKRSNPAEAHSMRERWPQVLAHDPFSNPNLQPRPAS